MKYTRDEKARHRTRRRITNLIRKKIKEEYYRKEERVERNEFLYVSKWGRSWRSHFRGNTNKEHQWFRYHMRNEGKYHRRRYYHFHWDEWNIENCLHKNHKVLEKMRYELFDEVNN